MIIFILFIAITSNGRPAMTTQEFSSQQKCEEAKRVLQSHSLRTGSIEFIICVPK